MPVFPGGASLASSDLENLKPDPEAETPGKENKSFSHEDWGCVSVCCLVTYEGLSLFLFQTNGPRNTDSSGYRTRHFRGIPVLFVCACWLEGAGLGCSTQGQALLPELQAVGSGVKMVSTSTSLNKEEGECRNGSCRCFYLWGESQQFPGSQADALRLASKSPLSMV